MFCRGHQLDKIREDARRQQVVRGQTLTLNQDKYDSEIKIAVTRIFQIIE